VSLQLVHQIGGQLRFIRGVTQGTHLGQFDAPMGMALTTDETRLLIADTQNRRVVVADAATGVCIRLLKGPIGTLHRPCGVTVVPATKQVLVVDSARGRVVVFAGVDDDTVVSTLGSEGNGPNQLNCPSAVAVWDEDFPEQDIANNPVAIVCDTGHQQLALLRVKDGMQVGRLGCHGTDSGSFQAPQAISVLPTRITGAHETWIAVTDGFNCRVQILTTTGASVRVLTACDGVSPLGNRLNGVAVSVATDELIVSDAENNRVVAWRLSAITTTGGSGFRVVDVTAPDATRHWRHPAGVVTNSNRELWVSDPQTHTLYLCGQVDNADGR
jgi:DNA-binding beta-propeller fold protein YncE